MALFELTVLLLFAGAVLAALARRLQVPYPALLALAGLALGFIPHVPRVSLDPQLALALFVAPVLLDAAFDASPRDLRQYWRPVAALALGAVAFTVVSVALVARWMVPDLSWPAAIALGAIVAPPDAAAATAVLRQLRPPHRLLVILEGESLFNDASALLIFRVAVAAAAGTFGGWGAIPTLVFSLILSVVLGAVLARLVLWISGKIQDVATSVIVQFLSTFAVWILADTLNLSAIITVVVYAIYLGREAPALIPARLRIPSYAVWEVVVFILNVLAFILVGLQLHPILDRLNPDQLEVYLVTGAAVCAATIVVRIVWVSGYYLVARTFGRGVAPTARGATLVAWCGMRGIVTLAAALALPDDFPHRDLVLFAAFAVVVGTLVVQGLTLKPLMGLLGLEDDGSVEREVEVARAETARAGLGIIAQGDESLEMELLLRRKYERRLRRASGRAEPSDDAAAHSFLDARRRAQAAERQTLVELRAKGVIGDDAFHQVEEELDWADLDVDGMARRG